MKSGVVTRLDSRTEDVFLHWCNKLGLYGEESAVHTAHDALAVCLVRLRGWPLRVCIAASLWFDLKLTDSTWQSVKSVEPISGVLAKLILAT